MSNDDLVELLFDEILYESDLAFLFNFHGDEVWIPKSLIHNEDFKNRLIHLPSWKVVEEGLEQHVVGGIVWDDGEDFTDY